MRERLESLKRILGENQRALAAFRHIVFIDVEGELQHAIPSRARNVCGSMLTEYMYSSSCERQGKATDRLRTVADSVNSFLKGFIETEYGAHALLP